MLIQQSWLYTVTGCLLFSLALTGCQPITAPPANAPVPAQPSGDTTNLSSLESQLVEQATALVQAEVGAQAAVVELVSIEAVNWPDSSLGCPQPDMAYAQMITPGYRIILQHSGQHYEFHAANQPGSEPIRCERQ